MSVASATPPKGRGSPVTAPARWFSSGMKKNNRQIKKPLSLDLHTVRPLADAELRQPAGGYPTGSPDSCAPRYDPSNSCPA